MEHVTKEAAKAATAKPPFALPVAGGRNVGHVCLALGTHVETALRRHLARHHVEVIEEGVHGGSRGESLSLYVRDPSGECDRVEGAASRLGYQEPS